MNEYQNFDRICCCDCEKYPIPEVRSRRTTFSYKGENLSYIEYYCVCPICGSELYSSLINDVNCLERERVVEEVRRTNALLGWSE